MAADPRETGGGVRAQAEERDAMPDEQRSSIIRTPWPDVEVPDVSLPAYVFARAAERGDKPALIDGPSGRGVTYAELARQVRQAAAGLAARSFKRGDVLGLYSPNAPEFALA